MKWNIYLYSYTPVEVLKVGVVSADDPIKALEFAHTHKSVLSKTYDGLEVRRADRPHNIREMVEVEMAKRRGEGRAWTSQQYRRGRPSKQARAAKQSFMSDNVETTENDHRSDNDSEEDGNTHVYAYVDSQDYTALVF